MSSTNAESPPASPPVFQRPGPELPPGSIPEPDDEMSDEVKEEFAYLKRQLEHIDRHVLPPKKRF